MKGAFRTSTHHRIAEIIRVRAAEWDRIPATPEFFPARWDVLRVTYQELHALNSKLLLSPAPDARDEAAASESLQTRIRDWSGADFAHALKTSPALTLEIFLALTPSTTATPGELPSHFPARLAREDQKLERELVVLGTTHVKPAWRLTEWRGKTPMREFEKSIRLARDRNFPGAILLWIDAPHPPDSDGNWTGNWVFLAHPAHSLLPPVLSSSPN